MRHLTFIISAIFALLLTACAGNPPSYLPSGHTPIVNVEAPLSEKIDVEATADQVRFINKTAQDLRFGYKLFWYDLYGVTQSPNGQESGWAELDLLARQQMTIRLVKPSEESENYRVYLRSPR